MNAATCLVDVARHFSIVPGIDIVKVRFEEGHVHAEAMNGAFDEYRVNAARLTGDVGGLTTVVCYANFEPGSMEIEGSVGVQSPEVLHAFATLHAGVIPQVVSRQTPSGDVWLEIVFQGLDGDVAYKSLVSEDFVETHVRVPAFKGESPDLSYCPDAASVKLMRTIANQAKKKGFERFWPVMNKRGRLFFSFDIASPVSQARCFEMVSGLPFQDLAPYCYDATQVLKVLEIAQDDSRPITMQFFNQGALKIELCSAAGGRYQYILFGTPDLIDESSVVNRVKNLVASINDDVPMQCDWAPE